MEGKEIDADSGEVLKGEARWVWMGGYARSHELLNGEIGELIQIRMVHYTWKDHRRWRRSERRRMLHKLHQGDFSRRYVVEWFTCENCNRDVQDYCSTQDGVKLCEDCYLAMIEGLDEYE